MARKISARTPQILPAEIRELLSKRFHQAMGLFLIGVAVFLCLSLVTYNSNDASLSTASVAKIANWFDYSGAIVADVLLQSFGISSFMMVLALILWGGVLMVGAWLYRPVAKIVLLLLSLVLASTALTAAPKVSWFFGLPSLGGVCGQVIVNLGLKLVPLRLLGWVQLIAAAVCGIVYAAALGLNLHQWGLVFGQAKTALSSVQSGFRYLVQGISHYILRRQQSRADDKQISPVSMPILRADIADKITSSQDESSLVPIKSSVYEDNTYSDSMIDTYEESLVEKPVLAKQNIPASQPQRMGEYQLPSIDLLDVSPKKVAKGLSNDQLQEYAVQLEQVLAEFGVRGEIVGVCPGPVVTLYELKPAAGIKTSRVIGLADDIARSMSAHSARIAVIPGRNVIGIEMPNPTRETVYLRDLLLAEDYQKHSASLAMILGKDIGGNPIIADLARMPHLLVAGTTGSGKSVSVNTMILSLLYRLSPDQCKFIMIDPKMLEFSAYDGIPHLLTPVVTDPKKAVVALKWAVREMESRYRAMSKLSVRNIDGYNARIQEARESGELLMRRVQTGFDPDTGKPIFENQSLDITPLPYIVVVVDEMADLMLVAGKEIESAVQRLAQMARAAGIHLIMATQRPSVDVITGTIKANFPTRISFMVTSKIDSRTILGEQGAEQLLGQGDMLYMMGGGRLLRVHGPFVKDTEVERIVQYLKTQGEPSYIDSVTEDDGETFGGTSSDSDGGDALYTQAVDLVRREGKASTSFVQRHLQIGYNRAARMIEQMEKEGLISTANHVGKREVIG